MSKKISAVFFDMDGTLMDTVGDLANAFNLLLTNHQRPTLSLDTIREIVTGGSKTLIKRGFGFEPDHAEYTQLREEFISLYDQNINACTTLFPGATELLNFLNQHNILWGIVTNKPAWLADALVDDFNLRESCQCVVGYDTVNASKPKPDSLLYALKLTGASAENTLYVGDSRSDIIAAKAANIESVAVTYGYRDPQDNPHNWQADHVIDSLSELIDIINLTNNS